MIAFLVLRGAGKTNVPIQVMVGVLTVAAVILGQIFTVAWIVQREIGTVNVRIALDVYKESISMDVGSFLFALGGGLLGAWYGAKFASKPTIEPQIELAPAEAV